ncbi:MAG: UDP-2,3-diacylglucosamine diphosphatase LpxI [Afipia felis]|nr:UDP-2,3-diacylglucosamine diphosphatase LpxI [Afipia felis]
MNNQADHQRPVGLIAGGGALPFALADSLLAQGRTPIFIGLKGFCDPQRIANYRHRWFSVGQFGSIMKALREEGCTDVTFIGNLVRPAFRDLRFDWSAVRLLPRILNGLRGGDDHILSATARVFEDGGFRVLGVRDLAPDLLMPSGCLTRTQPDAASLADAVKGREVLQAISPFDVGQAVVVIDGHVVSVEDIEGTDALLARIKRLRENGRLRAKPGRGVLVKAPKQGQDLRLDLPALGPQTIRGLMEAGLAGLAVAAGHSVVAEPQAMIEAADSAGIFVVGQES